MKIIRGTLALVIIASTASMPVARAESDFVIQAGAIHPTSPDKMFEYTRFYPKTLQVHRGQTVTWKILGGNASVGFHTVTFIPADGPQRPGLLRADELPNYHNASEQWWQSSTCGGAGEAACVLGDDATFVSSGIPPLNPGGEFSTTFDLPAGTYRYICTVHVSMQGSIEVVDDAAPLASQSEIDAQTAAEIASDTANAEALEGQDPGFTLDGDRKIWNVLLGDSTADNHVAINQFIPAALTIAAGDGVRYYYDEDIVDEIHTVSFPGELSGDFSFGGMGLPWGKAGFGFAPRCDFDDPFSGAPGIPGPFGVTPVPCPGNLEFGVAPWMTTPQPAPDNMVLPGALHDSGILAPVDAPDSYRALPGDLGFMPSEFAAEFPVAGTYQYECNVHSGTMTGSVSVS